MQHLIKQEQFEIEILDRLNSWKLLRPLIFCGGTMLRLCHGLNRYSVDLDFWLATKIDARRLFNVLKDALRHEYTLTDATNKRRTILFEVKSHRYPRRLKIEIRKESKKLGIERAIAYSRYSNTQVILSTASLKEMMDSKIEAFLSRKEIRDVFDIEFLFKKGIALPNDPNRLQAVLSTSEKLSRNDYTVKLSSLLDADQRQYYLSENFKIIKRAIAGQIGASGHDSPR